MSMQQGMLLVWVNHTVHGVCTSMCVKEDDKIKLYVQGTRIQNEDGGGRVGIPYIVHTYICRWGVYEYVEGDDRSMGNSNVLVERWGVYEYVEGDDRSMGNSNVLVDGVYTV